MNQRSEARGQRAGNEPAWFYPLLCSFFLLAPGLWPLASAHAAQPIVTDSRIKTFVYNANEVFSVTTEYGYQSNIEFADNEMIDTISVGDRVSWQIIPAGRRLFIRAMEDNAHTNMTVITNRRAYQFDLRASTATSTIGSEQLVYVVRFFYPGESAGPAPMAGSFTSSLMNAPAPLPASYIAPAAPMAMAAPTYAQAPTYAPPLGALPVSTGTFPQAAPPMVSAAVPVNYRYTFSGPAALAPVKIYDDGRTTYFKFRGATPPSFSVITAAGEELSVPTRAAGPDMVAVDVIAPRFSLRSTTGQQVVVYNESNGA